MEESLSVYFANKKGDIKSIDVLPRQTKIQPNVHFITSIVGPRRVGKTYLMYRCIKDLDLKDEEYVFVNFEEILQPLDKILEKHIEMYGKAPKYVFLDEIQALPKWERELYSLYERKRFSIVISGSSSKFLSSEIATQLRGRSNTVRLYPFSFEEIITFNQLKKSHYGTEDIGKIKKLLYQTIINGGYPDIVLKRIEASRFVLDYINLVIYKDIIERYGIENRVGLEYFVKSAINSNCKIFSAKKIYDSAKSLQIRISKDTIYEFEKLLEDISIIFFIKKYSQSIRKIEASFPKSFVVDNALYSFSVYKQDVGTLMESFVFQELIKKGHIPNKTLFYFSENYEVDFVIKEDQNVKQLIQVTYASSKDDIEKREIRSLLKASEQLKCKDLLVITWDYEDEEEVKGKKIKYKPLWKWLLNL